MNKEFEIRRPDIKQTDPDLAKFIERNALLINGGEISNQDVEKMFDIVEAAKKVAPIACRLKENSGIEGFVLAVSKKTSDSNKQYPTLFVVIGNVGNEQKEFKLTQQALLKTLFIKEEPDSTSSSQNLWSSKGERMKTNDGVDVDGGALLFKNDWIVGISGLATPQMDTVAVLAISFGAKLIEFDEASERAHHEGVTCRDLFTEHSGILTDPFLSKSASSPFEDSEITHNLKP